MHKHQESRKSKYSADQIYNLVADVENYPKFLPWVSKARILSKEEGGKAFTAELMVNFKSFTDSYVSKVNLLENKINVELVRGPFSYLSNNWQFIPQQDGSIIEFEIRFALKSKLLNFIMGSLFDKAVRKMVAAFEARADEVYGLPDKP